MAWKWSVFRSCSISWIPFSYLWGGSEGWSAKCCKEQGGVLIQAALFSLGQHDIPVALQGGWQDGRLGGRHHQIWLIPVLVPVAPPPPPPDMVHVRVKAHGKSKCGVQGSRVSRFVAQPHWFAFASGSFQIVLQRRNSARLVRSQQTSQEPVEIDVIALNVFSDVGGSRFFF